MEQVAKVMEHFQIALPAKVRVKYHIRIGDFVEVAPTKEGILLKPKELIDKSQTYFWTKEWQNAENMVERDFEKGRVKTFDTVEDFLKDLNK